MLSSPDNSSTSSDGIVSRWDRFSSFPFTDFKIFRIQVQKSEIGYFNAILEAYDHVLRVRTESIKTGILCISVASHFEETYRDLMKSLQRERKIIFLP
jgi:hypothetical protein